ncbi:MAG: methyltransferase domain-containing protein [Microthrixaceae bacterium]
MSDCHTHGHHQSVLRSHLRRSAQNSAAYLLEHLREGDDILDIGCGPGNITVDLARLVAPGRALGIDASEDVIDRAPGGRTDRVGQSRA